jgi:hypothetical protein
LTEITGDIGSNCSYFEFENVAYNSTDSCIKLIGVKVTFKGNCIIRFYSALIPEIIRQVIPAVFGTHSGQFPAGF